MYTFAYKILQLECNFKLRFTNFKKKCMIRKRQNVIDKMTRKLLTKGCIEGWWRRTNQKYKKVMKSTNRIKRLTKIDHTIIKSKKQSMFPVWSIGVIWCNFGNAVYLLCLLRWYKIYFKLFSKKNSTDLILIISDVVCSPKNSFSYPSLEDIEKGPFHNLLDYEINCLFNEEKKPYRINKLT